MLKENLRQCDVCVRHTFLNALEVGVDKEHFLCIVERENKAAINRYLQIKKEFGHGKSKTLRI